jgi:hypothetical protein
VGLTYLAILSACCDYCPLLTLETYRNNLDDAESNYLVAAILVIFAENGTIFIYILAVYNNNFIRYNAKNNYVFDL